MKKQELVEKGSTPEERLLALYSNISNKEMIRAYEIHNVTTEKVKIFSEFVTTLINTVYDTFLGNDSINNEHDIVTHFQWCFNKACQISGIYKYNTNKELYDYFIEYFRINIYLCEESREIDLDYFSFFLKPMENEQKFMVSSFIDLYQIFDKTEKNGRVLVSKPKNRTRR
jgi:hypothetical protein